MEIKLKKFQFSNLICTSHTENEH